MMFCHLFFFFYITLYYQVQIVWDVRQAGLSYCFIFADVMGSNVSNADELLISFLPSPYQCFPLYWAKAEGKCGSSFRIGRVGPWA